MPVSTTVVLSNCAFTTNAAEMQILVVIQIAAFIMTLHQYKNFDFWVRVSK